MVLDVMKYGTDENICDNDDLFCRNALCDRKISYES